MASRGVGTKGCKKLRFFKILFDEDGSRVMYLPPMIAQSVLHLAGREIEIADKSGGRWKVTLSEVNGSLAFHRGWRKFFSDNHLKKGEALFFKYTGSHFVVRIFGLSACDKANSYAEMPRPNKRVRRNPRPAVEEETISINTGDIAHSDTPVASNVGTSQAPMDMELEVMMKNDDWCYQGEDRTILGDLSIFEETNKETDIYLLPSPKDSQIVSKSHIGFSEQAKSIRDDVQMNEVYACQVEGHSDESITDKLEKSLHTKISPSHSDIVDKTKKSGHDAEIDVIQTDQIECRSEDIFTGKFKKAVETKTVPFDHGITKQAIETVETKTVPFHHEITKQAIEKGCDTQSAAIHSSQADNKNIKKLSESSSLRKGIYDVSNVQKESYSGSPSIGSNKIPQGGYGAKSWLPKFPVVSPVTKDLSGKKAIKAEIVEIEDEASRFPQASSVKEPTMVDKREQVIVKVEPEYDDKHFDSFEAEVKSKLYLELPKEITSFPRRESRKCGKIVYLRDSKQRIWPLFYPNKHGVVALCLNWTKFCNKNNIEPGDKCSFQFEKAMPCTFRVDVTRTSGDVPQD